MSNFGKEGTSHTIVEIISPEKAGVKLAPCKHCGGAAEFRKQRSLYTSRIGSSPYGWIICLDCSIQTAQYSLVDNAAYKFIALTWNRNPSGGDFKTPFTRRGSHYEEV